MDRRTFLAAASAAAASAVPAVAGGHDPIIAMIAERDRLKAEWLAETEEDEGSEEIWNKWNDLEDQIFATPAATREGLVAQAEFVRKEVGQNADPCHVIALETLAMSIGNLV